ncbi:MAG: hypothetical protein M1815_006224 [Lichina confinis]|nr:MAG: hypothetical protein M1815_006224 [Lichina confinis]
MFGPNHGALGLSFTVVRALEFVSLVSIIGITANFISEIVGANAVPPSVLVGTLSVVCPDLFLPERSFQALTDNSGIKMCISVLYVVLTYILYHDNNLPFLLSTAVDGLLLIAVVVVAVTVGKPLSYVNCPKIGDRTGNFSSVYHAALNMGQNLNKVGAKVDYFGWVGTTKSTCYQMKAVWGLSIALCILFAFSAICTVCLWRRTKAKDAPTAPKSVEA